MTHLPSAPGPDRTYKVPVPVPMLEAWGADGVSAAIKKGAGLVLLPLVGMVGLEVPDYPVKVAELSIPEQYYRGFQGFPWAQGTARKSLALYLQLLWRIAEAGTWDQRL